MTSYAETIVQIDMMKYNRHECKALHLDENLPWQTQT